MREPSAALHADTREALADLRRAGGKAIVLLNRRGWSNFLSCRSCGRVWECPNCDVALVLHRAERMLACHHCGHRRAGPVGVPRLRVAVGGAPRRGHRAPRARARRGAGRRRLPGLPPRLGHRGAQGRRSRDLLARFEAAPAGVLVGTQMVAKGHDFPDVTLGVVLDADATLRFPDFRAEERTFALDRAARRPRREGRAAAACWSRRWRPMRRRSASPPRHDADGFLADELGRREALRYPPFADLIRVVCSSDSETAPTAAVAAAAGLSRAPARCARRPCSGRRRCSACAGASASQVVVKATDRAGAVAAVGAVGRRRRRRPRAPRRRLLGRRRPAVARRLIRMPSWQRAMSASIAEEKHEHETIDPEGPGEDEVLELPPEVAAKRSAALAQVRQFGDPVLKSRALPVERFDDEPVRGRSGAWTRLMGDALGIGLAATQVGVLHRLLVYRVHQQSPVAALVNPEIEWAGEDAERGRRRAACLPRRARRGRAAGPRAGAGARRARRRAGDRGVRASRRASSSTRWTTSTAS